MISGWFLRYYKMQEIAQQPEDQVAALKAEARAQHSLGLTLLTIHQLDSTYYGQINKSYQKEGIGILFTLPFQAYLGFWKNNRPQGLGLIVYPTGETIYAHFSRSSLSGAGVVDDSKFLRVGVFEGLDLAGVGFEYTYATSKWRMLKYVRGVPMEQLREEAMPLSEGLPDMISAQHSLHQLLNNYLQARFFQTNPVNVKKGKAPQEDKYNGLNEVIVSSKEELLALGFRDQGGLHGLSLIFNRKERILVEAGYYMGGSLEGYCLQQVQNAGRQIGPFFAGVRHGTFARFRGREPQGVEYREGVQVGENVISQEQLMKRQKSYNFQQKDFLSAKNTVDFDHLFELFTPPQARHKSPPKEMIYEPAKTTEMKYSKSSKKSGRKSEQGTLLKDRTSHSFLQEGEREGERSCLDIMRQKMRGYDVVRYQKNARMTSEEKRKRILDSNLRVNDEAEESIAQEENPFDSALIGNNLLHESPKRRH